jgi:hypothetical protein
MVDFDADTQIGVKVSQEQDVSHAPQKPNMV